MGGLAIAAGVTMGTGILFQAYGMYQQSQAYQTQQELAAQQAQNNRELSLKQAEDAYWRGEQDETEFRRNINQLKEQQKVSFAAAGFDVASESAMDLLLSTTEQAENDAFRIRTNASNEALAYLMGAQNYSIHALMNQYSAQAAQAALPIQIGGTVLTGAGQIAIPFIGGGGGSASGGTSE